MSDRDPTAGLPPDLAALLRDPSIIVPQDAAVFELIAKWMDAPSNTASALTADEWRDAWVYSTNRFREAEDALAQLRAERDTLHRAVDDLHGEVSRWLYLDKTPDDPDTPPDWRELATDRAEYVRVLTHRALASVPDEEQAE